jgi:hypothetical protein
MHTLSVAVSVTENSCFDSHSIHTDSHKAHNPADMLSTPAGGKVHRGRRNNLENKGEIAFLTETSVEYHVPFSYLEQNVDGSPCLLSTRGDRNEIHG